MEFIPDSLKLAGKFGANNLDPDAGYPKDWTGGIHAQDVYAEGKIGLGAGGELKVSMNKDGDAHFAGNVGIGTTAPKGQLEVTGEVSFLRASDGVNAGILNLGREAATDNFWHIVQRTGEADKFMIFRRDPGVWKGPFLTIDTAGNVSARLTQTSSRELKQNISELSSQEAARTLAELNPVKFNYKTDHEQDSHLGFIAEDVPGAVTTPDRKGVRLMDLIAVLTKVVQEQEKTISALAQELTALKERYA